MTSDWIKKKKFIRYSLQELRVCLMQDTDIISFCHWGWTLLPIPYLLADIITAETLYALFLFRPATYISLLFDTITLNILWLQRVPGMNISPSPSGALYLCDPASWCFSPQDNLKLPVPQPYGYTAVQKVVPQAGGEGKKNLTYDQIWLSTSRWGHSQ